MNWINSPRISMALRASASSSNTAIALSTARGTTVVRWPPQM
jgi:hypothetical protein